MSLIYSAISSLENKPATEGLPGESQVPMPPRQPVQGTSLRWVYAAGIGSVAAVVIGGTALAVMRERSKEVLPPVAASAPGVAATAPQQLAPPPVQQYSLAAPLAPQQAATPAPQVSAPTPPALAEKPVEPVVERVPAEPRVLEKPVLPAAQPQTVAAKAPRRAHPAQAAVVVESAQAKPAIDELNRLASAAKQAIDGGNKDEAESLLGQLAAHLPPESVTLLRLRAWQALRNDDQPQALALYGRIVERLPGDESASINLAVMNWKTGQRDEARRIVATLAERHPDSDTVRRYVAQFGEKR